MEIQETNVGKRISILEIQCVPIFGQNRNFVFLGPNLPENGFWVLNFKNLNLDSESTPPRYHMSQLSVKMDNFKFFGLNLGKLPNYMRYFGSNIVEGVTESLVEVDMSWVEVDGAGWSWVEVVAWFSNTRLKKHAWCDSITATLFKSVI